MNEHHLNKDMFAILHSLSSNNDLTQRDLRLHTNISLGKTNYLIQNRVKF